LNCSSGVRQQTAVDFLLAGSRRTPLLTREQEITLGRMIREWQDWPGGPLAAPAAVAKRGRRALQRFTASNIGLAFTVAKRYQNRGVALEDLIQSCAEGIHRGAMRFDPSLGYRPSSYLTWYATQQAQMLVSRQGGALTLPAHASEKIRLISRAQEELRAELGRAATVDEVAAAVGFRAGLVERLLQSRQQLQGVALDALPDVDNCRLSRQLATEDRLEQLEAEDAGLHLQQLLQTALSPLERRLVMALHLQEKGASVAKMASRLNLSRQRCRQIAEQALVRIRKAAASPEGNTAARPHVDSTHEIYTRCLELSNDLIRPDRVPAVAAA